MSEGETKFDSTAWMVTFSDLLTLLLTFFVLLLSMSSLNSLKLKMVFGHLPGAVGPLEKGMGSGVERPLVIPYKRFPTKAGDDLLNKYLYLQLKRTLQEGAQEAHVLTIKLDDTEVQIRADERGAAIALPEMVLFPPGEIELQDRGKRLLNTIGVVLQRFNNPIAVEGHTDNQPPSSVQYPTNWEVSMGRAHSVLHYLVEEIGLMPQRLSAAGYASHRPIVANDSPSGRAQNRRVEILLLKSRTVWR